MNEPVANAGGNQAARAKSWVARNWQRLRPFGKALAGVATVGAVLSGLLGYFNVYRTFHEAAASKMSSTAPHLSVVVLPFANTSGDPSQDYIADAITDDVTVELSKIKGSFVIGRGTAFSFKGTTQSLPTIARNLNVRYVLQGTVGHRENNFRITAQLIDGTTGTNIWADRIQKDGAQVEDIRRDIVAHLAVALDYQLASAEAKKAESKSNPDAVDLTMRAWSKFRQQPREKENFVSANKLFDQALEKQPDYAPALSGRAETKLRLAISYPGADRNELLEDAARDAIRAIRIDSTNPQPYEALSTIRHRQFREDDSITALSQALEINPNSPDTVSDKAVYLNMHGQPDEALQLINRAIALSPRDPGIASNLNVKCYAYVLLGKFADALPVCIDAANIDQSWFYPRAQLVAIYEALEDHEKATRSRETLISLVPNFSIAWFKKQDGSDNPVWREMVEKNLFAHLRKAGIPE